MWPGERCIAQAQETHEERRNPVAVVDDDESVRESLPGLLNEFGFASKTFATAEEFLQSGLAEQPNV